MIDNTFKNITVEKFNNLLKKKYKGLATFMNWKVKDTDDLENVLDDIELVNFESIFSLSEIEDNYNHRDHLTDDEYDKFSNEIYHFMSDSNNMNDFLDCLKDAHAIDLFLYNDFKRRALYFWIGNQFQEIYSDLTNM